jgi:LPS export ABC transporter protein LptC
VDFAADEVAERRIHHLVTWQTALAGESRTDNSSLVVSLAIGDDRRARIFKTLLYEGRNITGIHRRLVSFSTGKPDSLSQMTGNTRNLLLFVSLAGAAIATWFLARVAEQPEAPSFDRGPSLQGYYLLGATLLGTDDDGQVFYRVKAASVEQQAEGDEFVLSEMSVEYAPDTDIHWDISAAKGTASEDLHVLELQDEVRLVYVPDADQDETVFEMTELRLFADEFLATTDQPISMRTRGADLTAMGLNLNLKTNDWNLGPDVKTRFTR